MQWERVELSRANVLLTILTNLKEKFGKSIMRIYSESEINILQVKMKVKNAVEEVIRTLIAIMHLTLEHPTAIRDNNIFIEILQLL